MNTQTQDQSALRSLPVVMAQVAPRAGAEGLEHLGDEVAAIREEFPATRLVLHPDYHTCPVSGGPKERLRQYESLAEPLDGPRVSRLRRIARTAGVWLQPGTVVERGDDGNIYNTAVVIDPDGDLVARWAPPSSGGCVRPVSDGRWWQTSAGTMRACERACTT